ncbi:hypothetical protein GCM10007342_14690 [Staphylococcus pragensis]|nr:hypothetical protein GCM10007342_14690 [Staphylococcus pragensis]
MIIFSILINDNIDVNILFYIFNCKIPSDKIRYEIKGRDNTYEFRRKIVR